MSQKFLNQADTRTPFQKRRGIGMAKAVDADFFMNTRLPIAALKTA